MNRTQPTFATDADHFGRLGAHLWNPIGAATVSVTAPAPGDRVLDACCGDGASALPAARRVGDRGVVDAIDLDDSLLATIRRRDPRIRTTCADATSWPEDGYDVVQSVLGIFFFPDLTAGTDHLISRARPGGTVGFTIWRSGAVEVIGEHLSRAKAVVTGNPPPGRPDHAVSRINTSRAYGEWLVERGLRDVMVTTHPLSLQLDDDLAWLLVVGSGFAATLRDLEAGTVEDLRQEYLRTLRSEGVTEVDTTTLIGIGHRS